MTPSLADLHTLSELFDWRVAQSPQTEAYQAYNPGTEQWDRLSWQTVDAQVARHAAALASLGLRRGERIGLLLPNGLNAVCLDQAALRHACVPVPMHALDNPNSIAYILADSDASLLVLQTEAQWASIASVGLALPALRQVVVVQPGSTPLAALPGTVPLCSLADWLARGDALNGAVPTQPPQADDLAALVYTSGTTGKPKGVMLTHRNVLSNVQACVQRVQARDSDVFLSFLPLSHTFERTAGYYLPVAVGASVAFARSTQQLMQDFQSVRPTLLVSVPRIFERVHAGFETRLAGHPLAARLARAAQSIGWQRFAAAQGLADALGQPTPPPGLLARLAWPLLERLVARRLQAGFGGRLRLAVSGGAPLSPAVARCFNSLGVPIAQGYGMTESSPVIAVNTLEDNHPATVGRPLQGLEVRIADNRELQVRGPSVMRGYWKRDDDTRAALLEGGWLRTGDQAALEDGRIRILGRVKEIIVTSTGEKIAPADLELAITQDTLFDQAYAFGDNHPFIGCIVVLNPTQWQALAHTLDLNPDDPAALTASAASKAVLERIKALTASFPYYAQPRAVRLTLEPWTIENTLMTPTLKLKRNNLAQHFKTEIEALYRR